MNRKSGVSIVILGITVLVLTILSSMIVGNISENNTIEEAHRTRIQSNISNARDELETFIYTQKAKNPGYAVTNVNATTKEEMENFLKKPPVDVVKYLNIVDGKFTIKDEYKSSNIKDVKYIKELKWIKY